MNVDLWERCGSLGSEIDDENIGLELFCYFDDDFLPFAT
jgi:hypothetical protein